MSHQIVGIDFLRQEIELAAAINIRANEKPTFRSFNPERRARVIAEWNVVRQQAKAHGISDHDLLGMIADDMSHFEFCRGLMEIVKDLPRN